LAHHGFVLIAKKLQHYLVPAFIGGAQKRLATEFTGTGASVALAGIPWLSAHLKLGIR